MKWMIVFWFSLLLWTALYGLYGLRREVTSLREQLGRTHAESASWFGSLMDRTEDLRRLSAALLDALADVQRESVQQQAALPDGLEKLSREMALLTAEAPDRDARMSRAMEEGVLSLMQYAAGKTNGVEAGLG